MQFAPEQLYRPTRTATLRVLAINSIFPSRADPTAGLYNARALHSLAALASVRVICPVKWFPGLAWAWPAERRLSQVPPQDEYHGLPVTYPRFVRTPGFGRGWHGWMYEKSIASHLQRIVGEYQPHLLLATWAYPDGWAALRHGQRLGLPVVIKCVGSDIHQLLEDRARGPQVMEALQNCRRIITVSESLRQLIVSRGVPEEKTLVVYNGVEREVFRPLPRAEARRRLKLPPHGKLLLCVAALLPVKQHSVLFKAFRLLRRHLIDARLALVGEGPLRAQLLREARRQQVAEHVRFLGSCRQEDVALWMNACDVVCLASQNEGLPNVLVEALACGRPVIATRVGGIPELISSPDYGRLVDSGDAPGFAQALREVLGRPWDPSSLAACPGVISWQESARQLYEPLLQCRP